MTDLLWIELVCFLVVMAATFAALKWVEREVRRLTKMQDDVARMLKMNRNKH